MSALGHLIPASFGRRLFAGAHECCSLEFVFSGRPFLNRLVNAPALTKHVDARFRTLFIIPVVAFVEEADISTIHSLDEGMIFVQELPAFFERHRHLHFVRNPSRWIAEGIQQMPSSDLVVTTDQHPFKGFITDEKLIFQTRNGTIEKLSYASIRSIWLRHTWLFSDYDQMTIIFTDESFREFECASGNIQVTSFGGEQLTHKLRNVDKIVIGQANKLLQLP